MSVLIQTTLRHPMGAGSTAMNVMAVTPALVAAINAPGHIFIELYNAGRSEIVLASKVTGTTLTVQRGMRGTTAQPWGVGHCLCGVEYFPGACPPDGAASPCADLWLALTVLPELTFDPDLPQLGLTPTGVAAGNYGGATVNQFGQFTFIPPNWPASALPIFDPCGCLGQILPGTGDDQTAAEVPYTPAVFAPIAVGNNVQIAIEQLEAALAAVQGALLSGSGVIAVAGTAPIQLGGTPSNPIIEHAISGITAGVYDGFTIDQWGHVVSYAAPPNVFPDFFGTLPVTVTFAPSANPAGQYTIAVNLANFVDPGVVTLINPVDILNNTVAPGAGNFVITWDGLNQFFNSLPPNAIDRSTIAAGSWNLISGSQVASGQGSSVITLIGPGILEVNMIPAAPGEYHVAASIRNDTAAQLWVEHISAAIFRIHFTPGGVNPATNVDFHVTDLT